MNSFLRVLTATGVWALCACSPSSNSVDGSSSQDAGTLDGGSASSSSASGVASSSASAGGGSSSMGQSSSAAPTACMPPNPVCFSLAERCVDGTCVVGGQLQVMLLWSGAASTAALHVTKADQDGGFTPNSGDDCHPGNCLLGGDGGVLWDPLVPVATGGNPFLESRPVGQGSLQRVTIPEPLSGNYLISVVVAPQTTGDAQVLIYSHGQPVHDSASAHFNTVASFEVGVVTWSNGMASGALLP